jgi:long-chain acyl-CoA synthetase
MSSGDASATTMQDPAAQDGGMWNIAAVDPQRRALVTPDERQVSFGALNAAANQVAHGLRALGVQRGDCVAVLLPADVHFYEVYFATTQIGVYLTPINYNLTGSEVAYILADCGAKVFVADERFGLVAAEAVESSGIPIAHRLAVGDIAGFRPYNELKSPVTSPPADRSAGLDMWYTSGTTGRPKGVRKQLPEGDPYELTRRSLGSTSMFGATSSGVHILTSPIYHGAPESFSCNALHAGQMVVLMKRFSAELFLQLVERHRVTSSHMVPTMFVRLLNLPEDVRRSYDVSSLRNIVHAAAPCPVDVKAQMMDWWGPILWEYYAASEGGGTFVTPEEWLKRPGTVGRPLPGAEVRILDDDGNDLPSGQPGNVYMRPSAGMFSYHNDPEKTKEAFRGEFFSVGDVGYLDDEGWLFLTDRKPDVIISGGVNIYPAEIEAELLRHPGVADAAVIGVPDPDRGEQVLALVQLRESVEPGPELEESLMALCRENLAGYKVPRVFVVCSELPRTETGKLQRRLLREPYWKGRERSI